MNLPNQLTLARMAMVPVFMAFLSFSHVACYIAAYLVFTVATLTDYYDGKIARERGLVTNFGKLLDPVADKVLLAAAFIMLIKMPELNIPAWTVVVIIAREFLVTGARSLAASEGVIIAANFWGKTKAVVQMVYIYVFLGLVVIRELLALWAPETAEKCLAPLSVASLWTVIAVALFTVYSGIQFGHTNWKVLNLGKT